MDSERAASDGALTSNPRFFGDGILDTISNSDIPSGWNDGETTTPVSVAAWSRRGGTFQPPWPPHIGIFASARLAGGAGSTTSHRTILLGY
ncbi:hypothetical protein FWG76_02485 [Candidatus Saccharibacteria bacterium]|nr:hypothetical protein [Candidatus Saccharibacteria bacterium]